MNAEKRNRMAAFLAGFLATALGILLTFGIDSLVSSSKKAKTAAFADPYTPVTTAIDIKSAYDAKCGAPSAGAPKVFFKYFYVNTATVRSPVRRWSARCCLPSSGRETGIFL